MTKVVIIGLGASGFSALLTIRKQSRDADITIISKNDYLMHPCGLPFYLSNEIKDIEVLFINKIVFISSSQFGEMLNKVFKSLINSSSK